MPTMTAERSRQVALTMLMNAIAALDAKAGPGGPGIAKLWVRRATRLLRETHGHSDTPRDTQLADLLLETAARELTRRAPLPRRESDPETREVVRCSQTRSPTAGR